MRYVRRVPWLLVLPMIGGCVLSGGPVSPYGRHASVHQKSMAKLSGELVAVSRDTIWLMRDSMLTPFASSVIVRVDVQRHRFGAKRTMQWMSLAGLATGVALAVACSSYESSSDGSGSSGGCIAMVPGTFLFFAAAGGIFALFNDYSSKHRLAPGQVERLRPFARFPQGMPDSVKRLYLGPAARP